MKGNILQAPFFSIVIPTFNRSSFLKEAVASALSQSFRNFEIIVVDDGSTDATGSMLKTEFGDNICYIYQENSGAEAARNAGIIKACGDYIVFLDSDDLLYPSALACYGEIVKKTGTALLIAKSKSFTNRDKPFVHHNPHDAPAYSVFRDYLSRECPVWLSNSFIVVKRALLLQHKILFANNTFPVDDLDFLLRAGTISPCTIVHSPVTVAYRYHDSNSVKSVLHNLEKLGLILMFERQGAYPGGKVRSFDRRAIIGGHLQSWASKGLHDGYYKASLKLMLSGVDTLFAIVLKKIWLQLRNRFPIRLSR